MNSNNFDKLLRQVVIVPVCALLLTAGILVWQVLSFSRTVTSIQRSDRLVADTVEIESRVVDQETGLRGYQLTRDPMFLDPYGKADLALNQRFRHLREEEEVPELRQQAANLELSYNSWVSQYALPLIHAVKTGRVVPAPRFNLEGKRQMDDLRRQIAQLTQAAQDARDQRVRLWRSELRNLTIAFIMIALVVGLMIGLYVRHLLHLVSAAYRQSHQALRIRAEQTFRSEEKLRTTLESIGDGVITCDAHGCVQTMNTVARELTGWSSEEALHKPLEQVFHIVDELTREPAESPVAIVKREERVVGLREHTILIRRDGTELFIDDSGAPIRDKFGRLTGIVLVFRDISVAKKSRDALLANEKLAVAGRLAAAIAHEIHNPLDSVANLLYLMAGDSNAAENSQMLDLARQEIARVTQISRAMLSLYRESRTPVPVDVKEMLQSILLLMEGRLRNMKVAASLSVSEGLIIHGFPAELRQVFTNLLTNAAEATGSGNRIQIVGCAAQPMASATGLPRPAGAIVEITDHGPGVPEEIREELFKPFFSTKGENGTGLGLWISKGIITKHGGSIDLASKTDPLDHGTTVTVFLASDPPFSALPS